LLLDEIAREGALRMLMAALKAGSDAYVERHRDERENESGKNAAPFDKAKEVCEIMVHNTERMVRLVGEYSKILDKLPTDSKQHSGRSDARHDRDAHSDSGQADAAPAAKK
jgi:hypothetical protein